MKYDCVIKNALIADGISEQPFISSIGIINGKISSISDSLNTSHAKSVIDAQGKLLCPGFIDVHSHSDISIIASEQNISKISQGFTTEVIGNCGLSAFPIRHNNREHLQNLYAGYKVKIRWKNLSEYRNIVNEFNPVCNIAPLCGYNTLRAAAAGYRKKQLSTVELQKMLDLLEISMEEGSFGLSGGFIYVPGIYADEEELKQAFKHFSKFKKIYTVHLKSEGEFLLESLESAFQLALDTGMEKIHISHLKTSGKKNWHKIDSVLEMIEKYRQKGLKITADRYPFIESMTNLSAFLPAPWNTFDDSSIKYILKNLINQDKFLEDISATDIQAWENKRLVWTGSTEYRNFSGHKFSSISRRTGKNIPQICLELLKDDAPGTLVGSQGMCLRNMRKIIRQDYVFCGTDESNRPLDYSKGRSHPRGFATAPRFFQELLKSVSICKAIKRMSTDPAKTFQIKNRGKIAPGYYADMVLFSPENFRGTANFANPHRLCNGIEKVWINGTLSYDVRNPSVLVRAGKVLNSPCDT